ncbi:MAG TPA: MerR family transcriptional regulator [Candidatus Anaerostipes avicola]|nr:MerR family transcriptional regulator [uncultured Anaerostipes sp.]HJC82353.1 MerR family transcriptional regulator [Candidatus Anaerostipes avicola]
MKKYKIGEVGKIVDIPAESIRFFESKGLISPEKDPFNKYRYYDVWDINRVQIIRMLSFAAVYCRKRIWRGRCGKSGRRNRR